MGSQPRNLYASFSHPGGFGSTAVRLPTPLTLETILELQSVIAENLGVPEDEIQILAVTILEG